ncbi:MAG: lysis protein [Proteobacteria bacterium]|nr:lysis protein [Pseudomonadota bacterium]
MIPLPYALGAAALAGALVSGSICWQIQDWRHDAELSMLKTAHAKTMQSIADETAKALQSVRASELKNSQAMAAADEKHTKDLTDAKQETDRLRACVRNGTCGVRIIAAPRANACDRPQDAGAGAVGDGAIGLDSTVSSRVLDLRESIQSDAAKLAYLRDYATACHQAGAEAGAVSPAD